MLPYNIGSQTKDSKSTSIILNNSKIRIKDIDFNIQSIDMSEEVYYSSFGYKNAQQNIYRICVTTENENYMKIDNWFSEISGNIIKDYAVDVLFNGIRLLNVFLIDYNFNQYNIKATLSCDYIDGNIQLLQQRALRKEKLRRINNVK